MGQRGPHTHPALTENKPRSEAQERPSPQHPHRFPVQLRVHTGESSSPDMPRAPVWDQDRLERRHHGLALS